MMSCRVSSKVGFLGGFSVVLLGLAACSSDRITVVNGGSGERGVLVDGQFAGGFENDQTIVSAADTINLGPVSPGTNNEVVGFSNRRPVAVVENAGWTTSQGDEVQLPFDAEIGLQVRVWIVKGPFNTQRQKAIDACITTSAIWNSERMGVRFAQFEIIDATSNPSASTFFDFTCALQSSIESTIGKVNGIINIYYVDRVDGGTGRGQACAIGSDFAAMGSNTGDELLSHELGHDFGLTHIDGQADYDQTNVMHSASNTRQFLTEGQVFRSHLLPNSALNATYNARPGKPQRNCPQATSNNTCVRNNKRIWADGSFPAN